jgi:hypothetical protein
MYNQIMQVYTPPKPAPLPADFEEFFATLTEKEKELHYLATEKLGSSYFIQWTHMYRDWSKAKAAKAEAAKAEAAKAEAAKAANQSDEKKDA